MNLERSNGETGMEVLNQRFGLRNKLKNTAYHNTDGSIPKDVVEQDTDFQQFVDTLAQQLAETPAALLVDTYTLDERRKDWQQLVKKDMTTFDARSRIGHKLLDHHMPHFSSV